MALTGWKCIDGILPSHGVMGVTTGTAALIWTNTCVLVERRLDSCRVSICLIFIEPPLITFPPTPIRYSGVVDGSTNLVGPCESGDMLSEFVCRYGSSAVQI